MPNERKPERRGAGTRAPGAGAKPAAARSPMKHRSGGMFSMDSEQSARMLIFGATAAVLVAAVAFIVIGYYVAVIQPRGRTVLQVQDTKISYSDMKRRMAYEYYSQPSFQNRETVFAMPVLAFNGLRDELTLVQLPDGAIDISFTDEEIEAALRTKAGVPQDADAQAFADRYRISLSQSRLHDNEYRRLVRSEVIQQKVRDKLKENTPVNVPQARVEVISVLEREEADAAIARINAGEAFADVAKDVSTETDVATTGGAKEFNYEGGTPIAYQTFAFSAEIGTLSTPLQEPTGTGPFYVVRVIERSEQPLTESQKSGFEAQAYQTWIEGVQAQMTIIDKWKSDEEAQASALEPLLRNVLDLERRREELANQPTAPVPTAAITVASGTPASGTPESGTPASGTPASGTPEASTPSASTPSEPAAATPAAPAP